MWQLQKKISVKQSYSWQNSPKNLHPHNITWEMDNKEICYVIANISKAFFHKHLLLMYVHKTWHDKKWDEKKILKRILKDKVQKENKKTKDCLTRLDSEYFFLAYAEGNEMLEGIETCLFWWVWRVRKVQKFYFFILAWGRCGVSLVLTSSQFSASLVPVRCCILVQIWLLFEDVTGCYDRILCFWTEKCIKEIIKI